MLTCEGLAKSFDKPLFLSHIHISEPTRHV